MKTTNTKSAAGNLAAGWLKLAPVLAAYGALRAALDGFDDDAAGRALLDAAPDLERELHTMFGALGESAVIVSEAAARAVAG